MSTKFVDSDFLSSIDKSNGSDGGSVGCLSYNRPFL
jgi:hypothetical protein